VGHHARPQQPQDDSSSALGEVGEDSAERKEEHLAICFHAVSSSTPSLQPQNEPPISLSHGLFFELMTSFLVPYNSVKYMLRRINGIGMEFGMRAGSCTGCGKLQEDFLTRFGFSHMPPKLIVLPAVVFMAYVMASNKNMGCDE